MYQSVDWVVFRNELQITINLILNSKIIMSIRKFLFIQLYGLNKMNIYT